MRGAWRLNRLGRRFMWASLGVLATAMVMIIIAAQQMFINDQDLGLLLWIMAPAAIAAALAAHVLSTPIARDAERLSTAARRVAGGDLAARSGVERRDELGDAAREFDGMVERLGAVELERTLMLSSISHDLRTPLAALRASVEALRDGVAIDPDASLSGMEHQIAALASLVEDLQLHTRLTSGTLDLRMTSVDLTELADEAIETVRPIADRSRVELHLDASERVLVHGDHAQLGRVIRNLLDNAIRHTPPATAVTVTVAVDAPDDPAIATLRVTDSGTGFPSDIAARAFEPFTRGDAARDRRTGTAGLGLAIAAGIVRAHGGEIGIVSSPTGVVELALRVQPFGPQQDNHGPVRWRDRYTTCHIPTTDCAGPSPTDT